MKEKFFFNVKMLAIMMVTALSLVACGGDDDDDVINTPVENPEMTTGQQRIELVVTGDIKGWSITAFFYGLTPDMKIDSVCTLKTNQTDYEIYEKYSLWFLTGGSITRPFPVIVTLDGNSTLFHSLQITKRAGSKASQVGDITVTINGYKGSKLTNTFTNTYKSSYISHIRFVCDKKDDIWNINGEESTEIYTDDF